VPVPTAKRAAPKVRAPRGGGDLIVQKFNGPGDAPATTTVSAGRGPRLRNATVNLIFWGSGWNTNPAPTPSLVTVANDVASILAGPYQSALDQYGVTAAHFGAAYLDTSNPPNPFNTGNVQNKITDLIENGTLPEPDEEPNDQFHCVMMPPGVAYGPGGLGGLHTYAEYTDLDWFDLDWNDRSHMAWVLYGSRANISSVFSHELAEACSDPEGNGVQVNPTNNTNWNEIGDVCRSTGLLNGVTVQSYWSQRDQACVIPNNVSIRRQISCIHKTPRDNPWDDIEIIGGTDVTRGVPYTMAQDQAIREIDRGNTFFVVGADGSQAEVRAYIRFPTAKRPGTRYIATVPDDSRADNLLSLPECAWR
jgi:hypothetical protein